MLSAELDTIGEIRRSNLITTDRFPYEADRAVYDTGEFRAIDRVLAPSATPTARSEQARSTRARGDRHLLPPPGDGLAVT